MIGTMSPVTIQLPDALMAYIASKQVGVADVVELGVRQLQKEEAGVYETAADLLTFFATIPTPEQILALRATPKLEARVETLLSANRERDFSAEEAAEWEQITHVDHLVRMAKGRAAVKMKRMEQA